MVKLSAIVAALERKYNEVSEALDPLKAQIAKLDCKGELTPAEEDKLEQYQFNLDELEEELDKIDTAINLLSDFQ